MREPVFCSAVIDTHPCRGRAAPDYGERACGPVISRQVMRAGKVTWSYLWVKGDRIYRRHATMVSATPVGATTWSFLHRSYGKTAEYTPRQRGRGPGWEWPIGPASTGDISPI